MDPLTVIPVLASPLLKIAFDGLKSFVDSEFSLISGANDEFNSLLDKLSAIQDVIEDAEVKQLSDIPIRNWLRKLKDVTYDVEDFLDEYKTDAALRGSSEILKPSSGCNNIKELITVPVPYFFCCEKNSLSRRTIAKKVGGFIRQFEEIAKQRSQFHLDRYATAADVQLGKIQQRESTSYTDEPKVYGREDDIEYIVSLLQNDEGGSGNDHQGSDVSVFAIVGMGGLGKTTLVHKVYHDERIKDHFAVKCWICVSEDFCPTSFIRTILKSLGKEFANDEQTLDYLQSLLQEKLGGKRFLVVLDDVWNEDQGKWETLKNSLSCGGKGSFIIVATRLQPVASIMALPHYVPRVLSEEDCFNLFKQRAFMRDEESNFPELQAVGREIVKKCNGIPLAAKALGGLLRFTRDEKQWLDVKDSQVWDNASDAILPALQLSYKHLSSQLKQCFAYCSIYPKDYSIEKEELIFSWMSNGFIQSKGERMGFEDVGNEIFNDLSWRSFFQDFEKDEDDNIIRCKMHDLMHDVACSVMSDECVSLEGDYKTVNRHISRTTRYVLYKYNTEFEYSFLETMLRIREFRLVPSNFAWCKFGFQLTLLRFILSNLKCLRVLTLEGLTISRIPNSIHKLKHLRYLNLSKSHITSLPKDFCRLINLQVLDLHGCRQLTYLPRDTRKMTNLRHLDITGCFSLTKMPIEMGKLISLRTLGLFTVVEESSCGITELKDLQHLKGDLEIRGLEHVKSAADARNANLILKHHLQSLIFCWSFGIPVTEEEEQAQLMVGEGLQPHRNLKRLYISGYGGVRFPHWIGVGVSLCLPNLVEITLGGCGKCEHIPQLGKLPLLRILRLYHLDSVKCISEFYHHGDQVIPFFPSLEELHIFSMHHFGEISSPSPLSPSSSSSQSLSSNQIRSTQAQVLSFPRLRILDIRYCPQLASFISLPPSLHELVQHNTHEELLKRYLKQSPSSLARLEIHDFPDLVSFPVGEEMHQKGGLINLTHLSVQNNGWRHLTNLRELIIWNCAELEFSHDDDANFQNLISLRSLRLHVLDKMTYFPSLPLLTSLRINYCLGLTTLEEWIPNLTSLQRLEIEYCRNLKSLPDEGLERLTALRSLTIKSCHPDLHRQCRNEEGHYWDKISHIPELKID
ncbi:hypothetical protein MKX03_012541 [Papaver bracteatum]|nr:hypothetical protein MKX03_012541 [Papaver bracteatum]